MVGNTVQTVEERRNVWVLLIIVLTAVPGVHQAVVLKTFTTYESCEPEQNRIGFEMAKSYQDESDYTIVCKFREDSPKFREESSDTPKVPVRLLPRQEDSVLGERPVGMLARGISSTVPVPWGGSSFSSSIHSTLISRT